MPVNASTSSDLEKLFTALSALTSFRSFDDFLATFGLANLPQGHKYGLIAGCVTFAFTILTVFILLLQGGSFQRLMEQAQTSEVTIPTSVEARVNRPLIMERLLESRDALTKNYQDAERTQHVQLHDDPMNHNPQSTPSTTVLTKVLMNVAPDISKAQILMSTLVDEDTNDAPTTSMKEELVKCIPKGYEQRYVEAYRHCQDKPGGTVIPGLPEAHFEAYARAYAGCGTLASTSYCRSYGRLYEAMACQTHSTEKKYREHWLARPGDIVGRTVRLEPLEIERHAQEFFEITNGNAYKENHAYDTKEVWCFRDSGPFSSKEEMVTSFLFQRKFNEAAFAIVEFITERLIGVVLVTNDDPMNLSISLEPPIVKPSSEGTVEQIEACFLLMDRLFALGYRRIQYSVDAMDNTGKKLAGRLGFTQEGLLPKHRIVKDSNRDSIFYGMLNSDWDKGARAFLFKKLHGEKAQQQDSARNTKEAEDEEQMKKLKVQKMFEFEGGSKAKLA